MRDTIFISAMWERETRVAELRARARFELSWTHLLSIRCSVVCFHCIFMLRLCIYFVCAHIVLWTYCALNEACKQNQNHRSDAQFAFGSVVVIFFFNKFFLAGIFVFLIKKLFLQKYCAQFIYLSVHFARTIISSNCNWSMNQSEKCYIYGEYFVFAWDCMVAFFLLREEAIFSLFEIQIRLVNEWFCCLYFDHWIIVRKKMQFKSVCFVENSEN